MASRGEGLCISYCDLKYDTVVIQYHKNSNSIDASGKYKPFKCVLFWQWCYTRVKTRESPFAFISFLKVNSGSRLMSEFSKKLIQIFIDSRGLLLPRSWLDWSIFTNPFNEIVFHNDTTSFVLTPQYVFWILMCNLCLYWFFCSGERKKQSHGSSEWPFFCCFLF